MKIKIHEVKGLTKPMNIYVEFNMDDESEPALQTDILEKSKDLVWDESCDVFVKDVHSKTFSISVHESIDCITRNEYHVAEQSKLSPKDYIGRASFWISLDNSTIEVRLSCSFMPIELVMDDNERTGTYHELHFFY